MLTFHRLFFENQLAVDTACDHESYFTFVLLNSLYKNISNAGLDLIENFVF